MSVVDLTGSLTGLYEWRRAQYAGLLEMVPREELAWEPLPVTVDAYGAVTVGRWGGYLLQILSMIYNDRVVLSPERSPCGYDHGWCYPRGLGAISALLCWDPQTQAEPPGYAKRATPKPRQAGEQAAGW